VCHQGAQASTKIGSFLDFASANARAASSSIQGRDDRDGGADIAEAAAAATNRGTDRVQRIPESYDDFRRTAINFPDFKEDE
jgi:hypothetical protein